MDDQLASGRSWVRADVVGTALFVLVEAVCVPLRAERFAQWTMGVVSMILFTIGVTTTLWAYVSALEVSRTREVGVANLFLLTGPTAPRPVKRAMSLALVVQVVVAVTGASVGIVGLADDDLNALAFGILVPMFGIGMNGMWSARYGSFGPRIAPTMRPSNRKIG
jgi:hypothetical protein